MEGKFHDKVRKAQGLNGLGTEYQGFRMNPPVSEDLLLFLPEKQAF